MLSNGKNFSFCEGGASEGLSSSSAGCAIELNSLSKS